VGKVYLVLQNPDLQFFEETVEKEVKDESVLSHFNLKGKRTKVPSL